MTYLEITGVRVIAAINRDSVPGKQSERAECPAPSHYTQKPPVQLPYLSYASDIVWA